MGQTYKIYSVFQCSLLSFSSFLPSTYFNIPHSEKNFSSHVNSKQTNNIHEYKNVISQKRERNSGAEKEQRFNYKVDMLSFIGYFLNYKIP